MRAKIFLVLAVLALIILPSCGPKAEPMKYPVTQKVDQVDDYFGVQVADPYRWLEDDKSAETAAWVKAQNDVTFGYLRKIRVDSLRDVAGKQRVVSLDHPIVPSASFVGTCMGDEPAIDYGA